MTEEHAFLGWLYHLVGTMAHNVGWDWLEEFCDEGYRKATGKNPEWGGKP